MRAWIAAVLLFAGSWPAPHETFAPAPTPKRKVRPAVTPIPTPTPNVHDVAKTGVWHLSQEYGLTVQWERDFYDETGAWTVSARAPSDAEVAGFLPTLSAALAIYPRAVLGAGKPVATIVLGHGVVRNGAHWGGMALIGRGTLLLDTSMSTQDELRTGFHHEMFHLLDPIKDSEWTALNAEHFEYAPLPTSELYAPETMPGFMTNYSRTSPIEDRADLFSFLVSQPAAVERKMGNDYVLRAKVEKLKAAVAPLGMDDVWWARRRLAAP